MQQVDLRINHRPRKSRLIGEGKNFSARLLLFQIIVQELQLFG